MITFNETHKLHGANLKVKLQPLVAALGPRKKGANRQGVFSKILGTAVAGGLRRDMMVKRVFVLSDMDFDGWAGTAAPWDTEYHGISNQFTAEGFAAPEVVFWNAGTSKTSMPVVAAQEGARAGELLLQEPGASLPGGRWQPHSSHRHGRRHLRPGVRRARGVRLRSLVSVMLLIAVASLQ